MSWQYYTFRFVFYYLVFTTKYPKSRISREKFRAPSCMASSIDASTYLVTLTAGMAYLFIRACSKSAMKLSPVTTPGGTKSDSDDLETSMVLQL